MPCLLKQTGIATFSAPANQDIILQLNALLGSQMTNVLVTDEGGNSKPFVPAGNAVTIQAPVGLNIVQFTFALSGAAESAPLVENCGGTPPATQVIDVIETGDESGFLHRLFFQGVAAAPVAAAGGN